MVNSDWEDSGICNYKDMDKWDLLDTVQDMFGEELDIRFKSEVEIRKDCQCPVCNGTKKAARKDIAEYKRLMKLKEIFKGCKKHHIRDVIKYFDMFDDSYDKLATLGGWTNTVRTLDTLETIFGGWESKDVRKVYKFLEKHPMGVLVDLFDEKHYEQMIEIMDLFYEHKFAGKRLAHIIGNFMSAFALFEKGDMFKMANGVGAENLKSFLELYGYICDRKNRGDAYRFFKGLADMDRKGNSEFKRIMSNWFDSSNGDDENESYNERRLF